jgi:uncharacterized RDD family membrane protein YckC
MLPENRAFLVRGDDGTEYGPVDMAELREWVRENRAGLGTVVRLDEPGSPWQPWQTYPELVALLAEAQVTSPVPGHPGLVIAPLGRRVCAFIVDLLLSGFLTFPILFALALIYMPDWCVQSALASIQPQLTSPPQLPLNDRIVGSLISDAILVFYMAGFHAAHGKTPAKAFLRTRVVDQNGKKPPFAKSFVRAVALVVSLSLYGLPLAYAFFNPQRRTFHDFIAGTYVVEA